MYFYSGVVIQKRWEDKQEQKTPVPARVKEVAGNEQQYILNFQIPFRSKPIQKEDDRKENREVKGIKKHRANL